MTPDMRDPRSGQDQGSDEVVDFDPEGTVPDPWIETMLWEGALPAIQSSEARWRWTPINRQAEWCGEPVIRLIRKCDGRPASVPYECDSWGHEEHAVVRARRLLLHFACLLRRREGVWYATFPATRKARDRMRDRRRGSGDQWVSVARTDSHVAYFSTAKRSGLLPPVDWVFLSIDVALLVFARYALSQPGVRRVDWSKAWRPSKTERESTGQFVGYGIMDSDTWGAAIESAAETLGFRYEVRWDPWSDPLPLEVPRTVYMDTVEANLDAIRTASRFTHGTESE